MEENKEFKLKQARYDLMQSVEILFYKKDEDRISVKIPFSSLCEQVSDFVDTVISCKDNVISCICKSDTLDDYTIGHSLNVCMLSILIGDLVGYKGDILSSLALSALLHDIGKRYTPAEILYKGGKLTDDEYAIMKKHPEDGRDFVSRIYPEMIDMVKRGIAEHHERMDGKGYPLNLSWYEISDFARIIAIADVYEAFTAMRSYHEKRTIAEGVRCIRSTKGLDKNIVELFTDNTVFYPEGMYVVLSDQTIAVVNKNTSGDSPEVVIPGTEKTVNLSDKEIIGVLSA